MASECSTGQKESNQGASASRGPPKEGLVRTQNEINRVRGTHELETAERVIFQDTERKQLIEGHLQHRDCREASGGEERKERREGRGCFRQVVVTDPAWVTPRSRASGCGPLRCHGAPTCHLLVRVRTGTGTTRSWPTPERGNRLWVRHTTGPKF